MKFFYSLILIVTASASAATPFVNFYGESSYLSEISTISSLGQLKAGYKCEANQLESALIVRVGADTRTFRDVSPAIYSDNYVFSGLGLDYLGLFSGVRATLQVGHSWDLSKKIHREGFDWRTGFTTWHEFGKEKFLHEVYSEALYIHRYRDAFFNAHWYLYVPLFEKEKGKTTFDLGPIAGPHVSLDSEGLSDYRYAEFRAGFRLRAKNFLSFALQPYFVTGNQWERGKSYSEFRLLAWLYTEF